MNYNYLTLFMAITGALKLILQPFGIEIPDEQANAIANGAAALMTVIGILMNHRKEVSPSGGRYTAESNK